MMNTKENIRYYQELTGSLMDLIIKDGERMQQELQSHRDWNHKVNEFVVELIKRHLNKDCAADPHKSHTIDLLLSLDSELKNRLAKEAK